MVKGGLAALALAAFSTLLFSSCSISIADKKTLRDYPWFKPRENPPSIQVEKEIPYSFAIGEEIKAHIGPFCSHEYRIVLFEAEDDPRTGTYSIWSIEEQFVSNKKPNTLIRLGEKDDNYYEFGNEMLKFGLFEIQNIRDNRVDVLITNFYP